ncbi:hypothetical protein QR680_006186 [Steinernema hermaphroditum]|uniref:G protein-coupled receptor n=1 Tax=Steinernema hermaphroditum TaxID=289476 RepID=A0AA39HWT9_9BILA|nr:hypothetical protein QR680_006186 [Steinernema hermaphroditum]
MLYLLALSLLLASFETAMGHEHHVFEDVEAYMKYLKMVVQYAALVLCAFIIFLSVKYVRQSLIRTYTLNICIAGLVCSVYKVTRENLDPLLDPLLPDSNKIDNLIDSIFHVSMLFPALVLHEVQGTLLIAMTYLVFSEPVKYRNVFSRRNVWISFIVGNFLAVVLGFAMYFEELSVLHTLEIIRIHDIVRFCLEASMITVMFTFYFKTLHVLLFRKDDPNCPISETQRRNRDSLKAVLIYCTTPNVFLVLGAGASLCSMIDTQRLAVITESTRLAHGQSNILMYMEKNTIMTRLFISSLCALVAFPQYRLAVGQLIKRPLKIDRAHVTRLFASRSTETGNH